MRGILRILVGLVLVSSLAEADHLTFDPAAIYRVPRGEGPAEGPADAPVTIVAWSDHACGYCNRVQHTLDWLARLYPGQIRFVHRTLPLDEDNTIAAEATLAAAAQGRFRPMNERIYGVAGRVDRATVELIARELGLDMIRFRADLETGAYKARIAADVKDAVALGVTGTPSFFVNGRAIHGNQPLRVFAEVVDQELARAAAERGGYEALVAAGRPTADTPQAPEGKDHELSIDRAYKVGLGLPGHQLGPDSALITIVAWGDFQCPFCAKMAPVLEHVRARYGDQVRVIYRHFTLSFHRSAPLAAEAAVAAAEQGKFWAFHDQVFAQFGRLTRADLEYFAGLVGLDLPRFRAALDERRYRDAVVAEGAAGAALGIDATPTLFVNGYPISGAKDAATIDKVIDEHLERARALVKAGVAPGDVYAVLMSGASGDDRADPSRVPDAATQRVALRPGDLSRAVAAACRRRDPVRAVDLATRLTGELRRRAQLVCAAEGIDLP